MESFRLLEIYHMPPVQFLAWEKPLKRFPLSVLAMITWLKPGANETKHSILTHRIPIDGRDRQWRDLVLLQKLIQSRHSLSIDLSPTRQIVLQSSTGRRGVFDY